MFWLQGKYRSSQVPRVLALSLGVQDMHIQLQLSLYLYSGPLQGWRVWERDIENTSCGGREIQKDSLSLQHIAHYLNELRLQNINPKIKLRISKWQPQNIKLQVQGLLPSTRPPSKCKAPFQAQGPWVLSCLQSLGQCLACGGEWKDKWKNKQLNELTIPQSISIFPILWTNWLSFHEWITLP